MKIQTFIGRILPFFLAVAVFNALCKLLNTSCLFLYLFGFPCPTCGMTHALLCALQMDVVGYMQYNAMAFPTAVAVLLALHLPLFRRKQMITGIVIVLLAGNLVYYAIRLL